MFWGKKKTSQQPFTFPYEFSELGETVLETRIEKHYPFLYPRMPFNFVNVNSERECVFYINQDLDEALIVPMGGGIVEADHIALFSWVLKNLYAGANKVYVTVQKE